MAGADGRYLFSDLELARRLDRAEGHAGSKFVEARAKAFPESGATWIEVAGTYAMYDGPASPVTQTFGLGLFEPATSAVLDEIEAFFHERGAPVAHDTSPLSGIAQAALLHERGYHPIEFSSVMYRPVGGGDGIAGSRNQRIQVRAIRDDEAELWARTTARGWDELPELTDYLLEVGPVMTRRENSVSLLAELDGQAIASGAMTFHGGVALFAGACTIPEGRRQGAQLALLEARLSMAAEQGCDLAMMCCAPGSSSQRNAERHGFRIAYTRTKWQRGA
jgi:hypothetical protein